MATESVIQIRESTDPCWRPSLAGETPSDKAYRKLAHAEALAHCMVGSDLKDPFDDFNDVLRQGVRSLLADLITEAREAIDLCRLTHGETQA